MAAVDKIVVVGDSGIILVHDLTNRKSHHNLRKWLQEVLNHDNPKDNNRYEYDPEQFAGNQIPILVVGTKSDLAQSLRENVLTKSSSMAEECGAEELNLSCHNVKHLSPEQHRTQTEWEDGFTFKMFLFKFVNYYSSIFYIAFFKGKQTAYVPKLVYRYGYSADQSMKDYANFSLAVFNVNDFQGKSVPDDPQFDIFGNVTYCRYRDYRQPPTNYVGDAGVGTGEEYTFTLVYWHILAARLAFIVVFENLIVFATWLMMYLIPDMPGSVKLQMLRENFLVKEA
ncbi:Anoctamin-4 [Mizuhopecten yessoensis]|uniref:Anoctamin n=1 Tax=Mizuhopecten yessoensis TaxID=6573 RepID=A0A210QG41_MIZYE|nr:Anoctamin-4 [Mizuhopecten yessoensis]